MARKKSKEELNLDNVELDENGEPVESKGSKLTSFLVGLVVVIIWHVKTVLKKCSGHQSDSS